ncbi:alpha/beta-hydrolase [Linderina pennispora]|uniref:Alpha/beta-hydrolase n=1 Tax=Linderina pennispora TaxID=61395 RepID=A0A1Y1WG76_9FUNG|nr:alpha/beta-hydrolase [Linderina pennispora]ORX72497.1 alpha/beta-hydrolase [Linderina pennispora]
MSITTAPYGSWKSPVSAQDVASASSSLSEVQVDLAHTNRVYWLESRPSEGGRRVLLSKNLDDYTDDSLREHTSDKQWNVRTAVHEYGGGSYAILDGLIVFSNWSDQGLYFIDTNSKDQAPKRIAEQNDKLRYANMVIHASKKFLVAVREDHREVDIDAPATLVAIPLPSDMGAGESKPTEDIVLFSSHDFVSSPVFSPKDEIAFYAWNHPDMNWDATTLFRATLSFDAAGIASALDNLTVVAGGKDEPRESIYQPRFDETGRLHFLSDRISGFWNPMPMEAEFGQPEWVFGVSTFQAMPGRPDTVVVTFVLDGKTRLGLLNVITHEIEDLPLPEWTSLSNFQFGFTSRTNEPVLVMLAGGPKEKTDLYTYFVNGFENKALLSAAPQTFALDEQSISVPEEITFPTKLPPFDVAGRDAVAYAYYYPPTNKQFKAPDGELPPLLVLSHGGPTGETDSVLSSKIQYWTTRGFAVADVNYGGSTGKGREYRERLYPQFGVVDVQDCCAAALYLAEIGRVDRKRLTIMGGSAGGFTTLACLAFRPEVFAVGASLYGISDLEILALETHKFESQYPVHLVGPYPEARDTYLAAGLEDKVVPPNQATLMVEALRKKGIKVAHIEFEGEQHGFRQAKNIIRALEAQFYFFSRDPGL